MMTRLLDRVWETVQFVYTVAKLANLRRRQPRQVLALQQRRLRQMLRFAYEHSPYYRRQLRGLDVQRCPLTDIPILTKDALMEHFDDLVTDRRIRRADVERFLADPSNFGRYYLDRYVVCHTSGSQGRPAIIVQTPQDVSLTFAAQAARAHALPKKWRVLLSRLVRCMRVAILTVPPGFYPSGTFFHYMPRASRRLAQFLRLSLLDPLADNVAKLNAFTPHFLTGYASALEALAREERAGRLRLRQTGCLQLITNISEPLSAEVRRALEDTFGVHVADHYAMGECMALTFGCPIGNGSHLNADLAYLEVVDADYRPVPPGTRGRRVLITNLYNRVQPLIRYEIDDVITLSARPCPCGSNLPVIESIEGRTPDIFWVSQDGRYRELTQYLFRMALLYHIDVQEFQVAQVDRNAFTVRVAPLPGKVLDAEQIRRSICATLEDKGGFADVHVQVEVVPGIAPDPRTGKVKRFVSIVGPPQDLQRKELLCVGPTRSDDGAIATPLASATRAQ